MRRRILTCRRRWELFSSAPARRSQATVTIATVNNGDMIIMQELSEPVRGGAPRHPARMGRARGERAAPARHHRHRDQGGQFDVMTIGTYEVPIWAKQDWLVPLEDLPADYDVDDVLKPVREGLSYDGKLYALPFYAESSMLFYRKDLFEQAGIEVPEQPTWQQVKPSGPRSCTTRQRGLRHLPARQARLGREHGVRHHDREHLRRAVVRQGLEHHDQHAGVEGGGQLLRRSSEELRPSGRELERLQREPGAVLDRQMRDVGRCHGRGRPPVRPAAVAGRGQARLRPGAGRQAPQGLELAVVLGARHPDLLGRDRRRQDVHHLGDLQGLRQAGRRGEGLGRRALPAPARRPTPTRSTPRPPRSPSSC